MLNRRQWLWLIISAIWVGVWAWIVTGSRVWNPSWRDFLLQLGEPQNAFLLLAVPALVGVFLAGRLMRLENWKQWTVISIVTLSQSLLWVSFLNYFGRHTVGTLEQFLDERRYPSRMSGGDVVGFALAVGVSLLVGGLLAGVLAPPGIWRRIRNEISTPERKQLAILLTSAIWLSLVVLSYQGGQRELGRVVGLALPAALFGGIFFWWFGRTSK
jgi:hypothetical protein